MSQQDSINPQNQQHSIDYQFISSFEGGSINKGYVPDATGSKSGVTVGIGFDLGARNVQDLKVLGLNQSLITKLTPFLGLQGTDAARFLATNELNITDEEATSINIAAKSRMITALITKYNADSAIPFVSIPAAWQSVIASVEFQYGSVQKKCPSFWRCVVKQDWLEGIAELRDFGDGYPTRRNKEADYVEQHM